MGDQIMKTRRTSVEVKPVSNVHRKHPVSVAVSMALLAAAAASAMAAESTAAPAENAGPAQQGGPTTASTVAGQPKSGADGAGTDQGPPQKSQLETIVITGVRQS